MTNHSETVASGTLFYYSASGIEIASETATIPAGNRIDFSAHKFGPNLVGLVEWRPDSMTSRFIMRNVRYYYDNPEVSPSFRSALQIEAMQGTGDEIVFLLDKRNGSAVIELSNATNAPLTVQATFRAVNGNLVDSQTYQLDAYASLHVIADGIITSDLSSVILDASTPHSLIAASLHYSRDNSLQLLNAYPMPGQVAQGSVLNGTYNTYLGQSCDLILINTTNSQLMSTVSLTRNDGTKPTDDLMVSTPALGITNYDLCANEVFDNYGSVRVTPESPNALVGTVLRHGENSSYKIATELREIAGVAQLSISGSPLLLKTNGVTGALTVINTSLSTTATGIISNFTGTALNGLVTETGNTCASLAPQASCTLTYTPGSTVVTQTSFEIAGTNTTAVSASIEIEPSVELTSINPNSGSASGGTAVTLTGINLTGATGVTFGGIAATSVNVVNSTTITAVTPAQAAGLVDVNVVTPAGIGMLSNGYSYAITAVGQSAHGGTIACLNGGLNNLIAALVDIVSTHWGSTATVTGAQSSTDGASNTTAIVDALSSFFLAAPTCNNYEIDSQGNTPCQLGNTCYNDWFLPAGNNLTASGQLNCLYTNRVSIGGFSTNPYWSSTESSGSPSNNAWLQSFTNGSEAEFLKAAIVNVRCVRAFAP